MWLGNCSQSKWECQLVFHTINLYYFYDSTLSSALHRHRMACEAKKFFFSIGKKKMATAQQQQQKYTQKLTANMKLNANKMYLITLMPQDFILNAIRIPGGRQKIIKTFSSHQRARKTTKIFKLWLAKTAFNCPFILVSRTPVHLLSLFLSNIPTT